MYDYLKLENLGGDFAKLLLAIRGGKAVTAFALGGGAKIHIAANLERFVLYVAADRLAAQSAYEKFSAYPHCRAVLIPDKDDVLLHRAAYSGGNTGKRIEGLSNIISGKANVAVIPAEAFMQYFPNAQKFKGAHISLKKEGEYPPSVLAERLAAAGYVREEAVTERGSFSLRGDVMDIFPLSFDNPIRIDFFDDLIEKMVFFDIESMEGLGETDEIILPPATDMLLNEAEVEKVISRIARLKAYGPVTDIIDDVVAKLSVNPTDRTLVWLTPFIADRGVIFDYLPRNAVIVFDEPKLLSDKLELIEKEHLGRVRSLTEGGGALDAHKNALLKRGEGVAYTKSFTRLAFQQLTAMNPLFEAQAHFTIRSQQPTRYYLDMNSLYTDLNTYLMSGFRVMLCCGNTARAKNVAAELKRQGIFVEVADDFSSSRLIANDAKIRAGFQYQTAKLIVLGTEELFGRGESKNRRYKPKSGFIQVKEGDYVVHEVHGIGICEGAERLTAGGITKDYVVIRYRDNDKLYVPVDQMDMLTKYSGDEAPRLNKIGGKEFSKIKEKAKASVKKLAIDLLKLYSEREKQQGFRYSIDTPWQREFEDNFEFELTEDQEKAVGDIKRDMETGRVMDRLICGDVGYGKTEVAFRAVFKTLMDNKQSAILAPTTILAKQHYNTLCARMEGFGIKIALLTRLQSDREMRALLKEVEEGSASVVIGTHRILSRDVKFHDLGLLVLDEEQRFGVEHKEKLKAVKKDVNVLTLTATPIPRTLNLALSGVRDISLLETPPKNRLPVQNYVVEYTDALLRDAVMREINRGGQVFVLYNYVETIDEFAAKLREITGGEARVMVAHGQMPPSELDLRMTAFYQKEANVLVATTIIENGIDLPDANTLFVYDADRFGLAELYQLRGRVGRSGALAHAYFTTRLNKVLTEQAVKRLTALTEYAEFGSGFKISMRDLEIRGAGSFLGAEQHGHIEKVGYELYAKLLNETVNEIKNGASNKGGEVEMKIDANAYVSESYVSRRDKIRIYRRISEVKSEGERDELLKSLSEIYGPPEKPLVTLINIALLKSMAAGYDIVRVEINKKGAAFVFGDSGVFSQQALIEAAAEHKDETVLTATVPPRLLFDAAGRSPEEIIQNMLNFLKSVGKSNG